MCRGQLTNWLAVISAAAVDQVCVGCLLVVSYCTNAFSSTSLGLVRICTCQPHREVFEPGQQPGAAQTNRLLQASKSNLQRTYTCMHNTLKNVRSFAAHALRTHHRLLPHRPIIRHTACSKQRPTLPPNDMPCALARNGESSIPAVNLCGMRTEQDSHPDSLVCHKLGHLQPEAKMPTREAHSVHGKKPAACVGDDNQPAWKPPCCRESKQCATAAD